MPLIDTHCHIHFEAYKGEIDAVLERARASEVLMITVGTELFTSRQAVEFASRHPDVWATIGLHPGHTHAQNFIDENEFPAGHFDSGHQAQIFDVAAFDELAKNPKVVAVGEFGLDYYRLSPDELKIQAPHQQKVAAEQLVFATRHNLPVVIHCRPGAEGDSTHAYEDFARLVEIEQSQGGLTRGGAMHCFAGTPEEAKRFVDLGFYISFSGIVTFGKNIMETAKSVPLDRILIETDSPYLAPTPHRGKRNEPAFVVEVAKKLAELKAISLDELSAITTANAKRLFGI